jgi:hypothetical protein
MSNPCPRTPLEALYALEVRTTDLANALAGIPADAAWDRLHTTIEVVAPGQGMRPTRLDEINVQPDRKAVRIALSRFELYLDEVRDSMGFDAEDGDEIDA